MKNCTLKEKIKFYYFSCSGRIARMQYFLSSLALIAFLMVLITVLSFAIAPLLLDTSSQQSTIASTMLITYIIMFIVSLITIYPSICIMVKRCHDIGISGWFCVFTFIPYLGIIASLFFLFCKGKEGRNRYGSDPLEEE